MSEKLQRTKPPSFDPVDWQRRQAARAEIAASKASANNIPQLVALVDKLETATGLR